MRVMAHISLILALAPLGCSSGSVTHKPLLGHTQTTAAATDPSSAPATGSPATLPKGTITPLSDADALKFMTAQCGGCHAPGKDLHSTWPMPDPATMTTTDLASISTLGDAYQAMLNTYANAPLGSQPSAMPPSLGSDKHDQLGQLLAWFQLNFPSAVKDAENSYGATKQFASVLKVDLNYSCAQRTTSRNYLFRLFSNALGRPPTAAEVSANLTEKEIDQPISDAKRSQLAQMAVEGAHKDEFYAYGLKLFAQRVGGSGNITANTAFGITDAVVADLQNEFYQQLLKYADSMTYRDILLLNKVQVTANTAGFYNSKDAPCTAPAAGKWAECTLSGVRSNYFGSLGFMRSAPSSFLASNNNYKRGGAIHAILEGELLMAQTNGPKGQVADPMPGCFTTADQRMVLADPTKPTSDKAPRGAIAIPRSGAVCQSCHLYKQVGVSSYVFRPFDENGLQYTDAAFDTNNPNNPYLMGIKTATAAGIINAADPSKPGKQVDLTFLKALIAENTQSSEQCVADHSGAKIAPIKNIGDLTSYMIGDGSILVRGISRYIPSAIANMPQTNQEVITAIGHAYNSSGGRLLPMFEGFFESETFSCAMGGT